MGSDWRTWPPGSLTVVGVIAGLLLGAAFDNLALWLLAGVVVGAIADGAKQRRNRDRGE